ncbi:unnamed protein product [Thelazia callipaeda]|uniref:Glutaredoxin domain-containing protein n=1 Tax=Thelazia callipaeda TaxID=103827 RepID=A0A158RB17_THECL|nr:unnamed protein product [Thelazia callipaeda]
MGKLLRSNEEFDQFINTTNYCLVYFKAKWLEMCEHLDNLMLELKDELGCFDFAAVEAEELAELSSAYKVDAAPTVIIFKAGKEIDRVRGFDPGDLKMKIIEHNFVEGVANMTRRSVNDVRCSSYYQNFKVVSHFSFQNLDGRLNYNRFFQNIDERLKSLINQAPLMLFMKGTPDSPKCGFSKQIVILLRGINADFSTFDVLKDEEVRQKLKRYSNWPSYPQLYLNGELIGGLDIVKEELKNPLFRNRLPKMQASLKTKSISKILINIFQSSSNRLKELITQAPLMLFMKGRPEASQCQVSKSIIELLSSINADYSTFDILEDEKIEQELKEYSKLPTYPQLYLYGELVGGSDVLEEELKDPNFLDKLPKKRSNE